MKDIHEFEVDDTLLRQGVDAKAYQLLLIKKTVGNKLYSIANTFNQSSISKRIRMMLRKKSNPWAQLKYLSIVILTLFSIITFAQPEVGNKLEEISSKKIENLIKSKALDISKKLTIDSHSSIVENRKNVKRHTPSMSSIDSLSKAPPLCLIDGKVTSYNDFEKIDAEAISKVEILKEYEAEKLYGDKGKNGVIIITLNPTTVAKSKSSLNREEPIFIFYINGMVADSKNQEMLYKQKELLLQDVNNLESLVTITGKAAIDKYGNEGKNGVFEIYLKK